MEHSGGHLPFESDVTHLVTPGSSHLVTVAVNNTLDAHTIPQGGWVWYEEDLERPAGYFKMDYTFDFFNYAGIQRQVGIDYIVSTVKIGQSVN